MPDISLIAMIGGEPTSGIVCSAYKASRFGALPVPYDTAAPGGAADATATSGTGFGGPGQVSLTVPTWEEYWVAVPSGGHTGWVKSPSPVVPESDVTALVADIALRAIKPAASDAIVYVSQNGNDANDGLSWGSAKLTLAAALTAVPDGGTVQMGGGVFNSASQISAAGLNGVKLLGASTGSSQQTGGTIIRYSGTATPAFQFSGAASLTIEGIKFQYSSGSFTGTLVNLPLCGGVDLKRSSFMGFGVSTALYDLSINTSVAVDFDDCLFDRAQYGILGQAADGTGFANGVGLKTCTFNNGLTAGAIRNPGQAWHIHGGTDFEPLANGKGAAIVQDVATTAKGLSIDGCWMGDATDVTAWTWVQFKGQGLSVTGCYIHGTGGVASTAIGIVGTSSGISVAGNQLDSHAVGVALGASIATGVEIAGNDFTSTTAATSGTALAPYYIQGNAGAPGGLVLLSSSGISWAAEGPALDRVGSALRLNAGGAASLVQVSAGSFTRSFQSPTEAVLVSGVNATSGDLISVTLTAARVVGLPVNPAQGGRLTYILTQGGAGGFAVTWNASFKKTWADTGNTTGKISSISFVYNGTNWIQDGAQAPYV